MNKTLALSLAAVVLIVGTVAEARAGSLRERLRERIAARESGSPRQGDALAAPRPITIAYGQDPHQRIDVWKPQGVSAKAPLVMYVHGGGWKRGSKETAASKWSPVHFPGQGYVYASINYRLLPENTVEYEASDVAHALKALLDAADRLGIDRSRVVIIGHSAGAHLVALVGTDESYLRSAGLSFADIDGVIPNDGAAYDVPRQMAEGGNFMHDTYIQAFGEDPARQRALSPALHADAPNAPAFLLLHVQRQDGIAQAKELEEALHKGGTAVERRDFPGNGLKGHMEINRQLGNPDYAATPVVDAWLKKVFGK